MAWSDAARKAALEARRLHAKQDILLHVTEMKNAKSIKAKGIVPFHPSHWIKAGNKERYGDGSIFAFEKRADAVKWAAHMDWEKNKAMGSGKIGIAAFKTNKAGWVRDTNDPLSQSGRAGDWLKSHRAVPGKSVRAVVPLSAEMVRKFIAKKR